MKPSTNVNPEYLIPIDGDTGNFLIGQLLVGQDHKGFNVEVNLIQIESKKLFRHIEYLVGFESKDEACRQGRMKLAKFLAPK